MKRLILAVFFVLVFGYFFVADTTNAETEKVNIIVFERDDCAHCIAENAFLKSFDNDSRVNIIKKNIEEEENKQLFYKVAKQYQLQKATPITLIGNSVIAGFDTELTTGAEIREKAESAFKRRDFAYTVEHYLQGSAILLSKGASTCESGESCEVPTAEGVTPSVTRQHVFSFLGWRIDIEDFGLFSISAILGVIDGFNPCAMWVLFTFLLALSQLGSRKKMLQVVGLFLFAEASMYFLILNVWYQTWDFIKLDSYVSPAIGLFSILAGMYFFYKWHKTKDVLVCDVTSAGHQAKISQRIQDVVKKPMTIAVVFAVLAIAFSVNIIEFACSIGIAQTFTKILEINQLNFLGQQFYILIYTIGYMVDDLLVFALALWGYKSFYKLGTKYSKYSTLLAAVLMVLLGVMLLFFRDFLIF